MQKIAVGLKGAMTIQWNEDIIADADQIPCPLVFYFAKSEELLMNQRAIDLLGVKELNSINLDIWFRNNPILRDMMPIVAAKSVTNDRIHVVLCNGKHEILNYSLHSYLHHTHGRIAVIVFCKASEKYTAASISSLYAVKDELAKLKPYLNREGKKIHQEFMNKYFRNQDHLMTLDDVVYYEKELLIIQEAFPLLTHREVVLCGLLKNELDVKDIAVITNRTIDSVFVTIHRINKKLILQGKKELVETLQQLVRMYEQKQLSGSGYKTEQG